MDKWKSGLKIEAEKFYSEWSTDFIIQYCLTQIPWDKAVELAYLRSYLDGVNRPIRQQAIIGAKKARKIRTIKT